MVIEAAASCNRHGLAAGTGSPMAGRMKFSPICAVNAGFTSKAHADEVALHRNLSMPVGSSTPAVSPQITMMLAAIQQSQAAELQVMMALEQGMQASSPSLNPNLGQLVNLSA
jgi:hypothetical protein